ncbi:hypothetical protein [Pseudoteredinibacter isoporae]|uniref:hypothetical protein n=1 Tax=Pseudoteredinibacter isoporae TaxID=570281 RepID=UPI0031023950
MLKHLFRWQKGRRGSGYDKMLLAGAYWPLPFDIYLLRFPEGSDIPVHKDTVKTGRHYRLNIVLKQARRGGEFFCEAAIYDHARLKLFRPDISEHSVSRVERGSRYVLSVGWVRDAVHGECSEGEE